MYMHVYVCVCLHASLPPQLLRYGKVEALTFEREGGIRLWDPKEDGDTDTEKRRRQDRELDKVIDQDREMEIKMP